MRCQTSLYTKVTNSENNIRSDRCDLAITLWFHSADISMKQSTQLRDRIEEEIATGQLKPGERLDEMSLAERFG